MSSDLMCIGETGFYICGARDAADLAALVKEEGIASCLYLSTCLCLSFSPSGRYHTVGVLL